MGELVSKSTIAAVLCLGLVACGVDGDAALGREGSAKASLRPVEEEPGEGSPWEPPPEEPPPVESEADFEPDPYLEGDDPYPDDPDLFEADPDVSFDESEYPRLVNGAECNQPTTVYLGRNYGPNCSGVLLAADLVLTAAHCVTSDTSGRAFRANTIMVGRGANACSLPEAHASALRVHRLYRPKKLAREWNPYDVALVKLATPLTNVTVATVGSRAKRGTRIALNGYGDAGPAGPYGTQRCVESRSVGTRYGLTQLAWGSGVCGGDSGGPAFEAGTTQLVGIMQSSDDPHGPCTGHAYLNMIPRQWLAAAIASLNNRAVTCVSGALKYCRPENGACVQFGANGHPVGECRVGKHRCVDGQWSECVEHREPTAEVCGDNLDNDCDGSTDEGCCGNGTCDQGETSVSCPLDCRAPDGGGGGSGGSVCICGWDCPPGTPGCGYCGDGNCDVLSENSSSCPNDCSLCGDGYCNPWNEDTWSCPSDCDSGGGGSCICGWDCPPGTPGCGYCGDGNCDVVTEDCSSCSNDCGGCGGGDGGVDPGYGGCRYDDYWWWYDWYGPEIAAAQCGMLAY